MNWQQQWRQDVTGRNGKDQAAQHGIYQRDTWVVWLLPYFHKPSPVNTCKQEHDPLGRECSREYRLC